jgi:hypothetical protein
MVGLSVARLEQLVVKPRIRISSCAEEVVGMKVCERQWMRGGKQFGRTKASRKLDLFVVLVLVLMVTWFKGHNVNLLHGTVPALAVHTYVVQRLVLRF